MPSDNGTLPRFRFAVFEADLALGELTKLGRRVPLQEQPFRVLALLLQKPGELVTREELRASIWPHTIVDFDHGLNKAVSKIRDALGDSSDNPRFIETIAGRGYRFLADVKAIGDSPVSDAERTVVSASEVGSTAMATATDNDLATPPEVQSQVQPKTPPVTRLRKHLPIVGVGAMVLFAAFTWIRSLHEEQPPAATRSLAVLPFENLSYDQSQEYFADGMTDELITSLGQVRSLRVISRTSAMSYRGAHRPLADIAHELHVDTIVEGSVLRANNRVRITAQLIRLPADEHIWAQSYEGDISDTITLQRDVAQAIVRQIGATLTAPERRALDVSRRINPEAYEAYLKGRFFLNKRTREGIDRAIEEFNRAVKLDAAYAPAYSGLADTYALAGDWEYGILSPDEAFKQSRAAAEHALALDETLAEAHTSLALSLDLYARNWSAAEDSYKRALQLNPGYATAHQWYAWHLMLTARAKEGLAELRAASALDPLSLIIGADLADALCITHLPDDSIRQSEKTLEIDPNFALGHYELGQAYEVKQQHVRAIDEFKKAIELGGQTELYESNLAHAYAVSGKPMEANEILKRLESQRDRKPSVETNIALVHVGLGQYDQAMAALDKADSARVNPSILLRPGFDPLRSDERFKNLWRKIGLPDPPP